MCINKEWRTFIQEPPKGVTAEEPTQEEFKNDGEEVEVAKRVIKEVETHGESGINTSSTFFYPGPGGLFEFVLGWNHGVVIKLGDGGVWEIEYLFMDRKDTYHKGYVNDGIEAVPMTGIEETKGWIVRKFNKPLRVSRVTTYNATTCSITIAFPRGRLNRIMMCHVDGSYDIPIPAMVALCQAQESVLVQPCSEIQKFCILASVCPGMEEASKFRKKIWITEKDEPTWDMRTLLLTRSTLGGNTSGPVENHTQFGLVLAQGKAPLFGGFLGWVNKVGIVTLFPPELWSVLEKLALKAGKSWDEEVEAYATNNIVAPLIYNVYGHAGLHKLCVESFHEFHNKKMLPCESYVYAMAQIRGGFNLDYIPLCLNILAKYQRKIWITLSEENFDRYIK